MAHRPDVGEVVAARRQSPGVAERVLKEKPGSNVSIFSDFYFFFNFDLFKQKGCRNTAVFVAKKI